jgi:hypothetical protein
MLSLGVCHLLHFTKTQIYNFYQEDFRRFNQSEHIIGPGSHVEFPICTKITNLDLPMNISAKFGPNLFSSFREEDENMKFTFILYLYFLIVIICIIKKHYAFIYKSSLYFLVI